MDMDPLTLCIAVASDALEERGECLDHTSIERLLLR
jgi:hypothetical protein